MNRRDFIKGLVVTIVGVSAGIKAKVVSLIESDRNRLERLLLTGHVQYETFYLKVTDRPIHAKNNFIIRDCVFHTKTGLFDLGKFLKCDNHLGIIQNSYFISPPDNT